MKSVPLACFIFGLLALCSPSVLGQLSAAGAAPDPSLLNLDWIDGPKNAFIVMPNIDVAHGKVRILSWTPDGHKLFFTFSPNQILGTDSFNLVEQALLGQLTPAPFNTVLAEWDDQSKKTEVIHDFGLEEFENLTQLDWLKDKATAFVTVRAADRVNQKIVGYHTELWRLASSSNSFQKLELPYPNSEVEEVDPNPVASDVVVKLLVGPSIRDGVPANAPGGNDPNFNSPLVEVSLLLDSSGNVKQELAGGNWNPVWTQTGELYGESAVRASPKSGSKVTVKYWAVAAKKLVEVPKPSSLWTAPKADPEFDTAIGSATEGEGTAKRTVATYWLKCKAKVQMPDLRLATSLDRGSLYLAPENRAVAIITKSGMNVRLLYPVDDALRNRLVVLARTKAMQKGKQMALGLIMFASDNDDNLPSSNQLGMLDPYLKDSSVMDGFNYQPPGNLNMNQWQSPAETVMGTVSGPGGQAVVYGDGHVKWQDGP